MAEDKKELQEKIEEYRVLQEKDPINAEKVLSEIKKEMAEMPITERKTVMKELKDKTYPVNGGTYAVHENIFLTMQNIFCDLLADAWMGKMIESVYNVRNGRNDVMPHEVQGFVVESLREMKENDPVQYEMFVDSINNYTIETEKDGVEKSAKVINIENEALRNLKEVVNNPEKYQEADLEQDCM